LGGCDVSPRYKDIQMIQVNNTVAQIKKLLAEQKK
jgi:hypothetical protein